MLAGWLSGPVAAYDKIGTAGPIRTFGGAHCAKDYVQGECDPPEVDTTLPVKQKAQARVERARGLIAVLRVKQAIKELDTAVAEEPEASSALLLRARLKFLDQPADALRDIESLIALNPSNPDALATRAFMLGGQQDDLALRDATKAVSVKPDDVDALCIRATILVRLGRSDEAEQDFTRALIAEPDNPTALLSRAELRLARGQMSEAERDADEAISVGGDIRARQIRAVARVREGKYVDALSDLNVVLGPVGRKVTTSPISRQFADLLVQRALVLSRIGRPDDAKADLSSIITLGGQRAILQMQLYLRGHGFRDVALDGKASSGLNDDLISCFLNDACGRGLALKI